MIASIRHKGLKLLWIKNDASWFPADHVVKIMDILTRLEAANEIEDMNFNSSKLHSLKGDLAGFWSVYVKANWRIIFRFEDGEAHLIDYLDYH